MIDEIEHRTWMVIKLSKTWQGLYHKVNVYLTIQDKDIYESIEYTQVSKNEFTAIITNNMNEPYLSGPVFNIR